MIMVIVMNNNNKWYTHTHIHTHTHTHTHTRTHTHAHPYIGHQASMMYAFIHVPQSLLPQAASPPHPPPASRSSGEGSQTRCGKAKVFRPPQFLVLNPNVNHAIPNPKPWTLPARLGTETETETEWEIDGGRETQRNGLDNRERERGRRRETVLHNVTFHLFFSFSFSFSFRERERGRRRKWFWECRGPWKHAPTRLFLS